MRLFLATAALFTTALTAKTMNVTVSYDQTFDNPKGSMDTVACSNGPHGLEKKGFHTFGALPTFPLIGGAPAIDGFDSPACGTCWNVTFNGTTATVAAIDAGGPNNFNIAHAAMDFLTGGRATFLEVVNASAVQVNASACGL